MKKDKSQHDRLLAEIETLKQEVQNLRNILKTQADNEVNSQKKTNKTTFGYDHVNDSLFRSFMKASPDILTITDLEGKIEFSSSASMKMFGTSSTEVFIGHTLLDYIDEADHQKTIANIKQMIQEGALGTEEYTAIKADGTRFPIEVNGEFIYDGHGNKVKMVFITRDITQRKKMEQHLQKNEKRMLQILETINDVVYEIDAEGILLYISPAIKKLTGYDQADFLGKMGFGFVYADDGPAMMEAIKNLANPAKTYYEFRMHTKDGLLKWFRTSTSAVFHNGVLSGGYGSLTDVTDIKHALDNVRVGDEKQRLLIDITPDAVIILDKKFNIVQANKAAYIFGHEYGFEGTKTFEPWLVSPERQPDGELSQSKAKKILDDVFRKGYLRFEWLLVNKNGEERWMDVTVARLSTSTENYLYNAWHDITESKKTEEALRKNEENLSFALQIARMGNYDLDIKTNRITHSNNLLRLFELDKEDYLLNDRILLHFIDTKYISLLESKIAEIVTSKQGQSFELKFRLPDNQVMWMKSVMEPVIANDEVVSLKGVLIDISDMKVAQENLAASEQKYRSIFENIQDTYYEATPEGVILEISPSVEILSGGQYHRSELIGQSLIPLYAVTEQRNFFFKAILETGKVSDFEMMLRNRDGSVIPVAITSQIQFDKDQKPEKITGIIRDISERKKAADILAESELKHRTLFETMVQGVIYQDADGNIVEANPAAQEILGLSLDQMQGRASSDPRWRTVSEDYSDFPAETQPAIVALNTGKPVCNTVMGIFHPLKNHFRWININAVPQFKSNEDKPYRVFTTFEDITETKLSQQKLTQSEENLNLSQEIAKMGSWELNMETFTTSWSKNYYQILGYQPFECEVSHELFLSHVHPDDRHKIDEIHEKILTTRKPTIMEIRMFRRDGTMIWIENNILPVFEGEKLVALKGSNIDITSKKENEFRIRQQNEKLNAIISALPDILFVFDKEGNYLEFYTKPDHELLTQPDAIIDTNISDHFNAEEADLHLMKIRECHVTQQLLEYEYSIKMSDATLWFDARLAPMGKDKIVAFIRNITEKKKSELEIKKLGQAVSQSPVMVMMTGLESGIEYVNQAFLDITGYTESEVIGKNPRILKSGKTDPAVYQDMLKTIKNGKKWSGEMVNKKKNNDQYWEEITITPIFGDQGEMLSFLAIMQDITNRKKFEKQLQEMNRRLETKVKERTEELALKNETLLAEISERKILYDALLLSESRLELAMEAAKMAWWEMNASTGSVVFHQRFAEMLGYDASDFRHYDDIMKLIHPEDRARTAQAMRDHFAGKNDKYETEYRIRKKSGTDLWYQGIGRISRRNADGSPEEVVGFITEITQKKNIELALLKKTQELENFFNVSLDLLSIADLNGNFLKVNKSWSELLGYPRHELEHHQFLDFVHPEDIPATLDAMRFLNTQKKVINFVNRYLTRSGDYRYIEWHTTPVGKTLYSAARDITDRKFNHDFQKDLLDLSSKLAGLPSYEIDRALKDAVQRIGQFLDADRSYIFEFDPEITLMSNTYEYCAPGINAEIGNLQNLPIDLFPKSFEIMRSHKNVVIPLVEDLDNEWLAERETFLSQQIKSIILIPIFSENILIGFAGLDYVKSAKEFNEATIQILQIWSTMLAGLLNNMRIESLLEQSRQNYETFFNTIDDFLFVFDKQGRMIHVNNTVTTRLGYTFNQLKDHTIAVVFPPEKLDEANMLTERFLNHEIAECSLPFYTRTGEIILAESKLKEGRWNGKPIIFMVGKDISQIKLSEEKFSKAFHSNFAAMAISTYEENARFVDVNNTFLKILGCKYDEVIGKTNREIGIYVNPLDKEKIGLRMRNSETLRDVEVKYGTKNGETRTGLFSSDVVYIGNQKCYLTALVDITERKNMESELIAARIEADEANKAKSEFLSRMSHEFRTPMNSILGFAQLLEMSELNPKQTKGVKHILNSGKHLLDLINEVLDISRIESGRLSLSMEPVQLSKIISEMVDLVTPQARARNVSILFEPSVHNKQFVKTDSQRLKQVLLNLIDNAIKYNTDQGSITISVAPVGQEISGPGLIRISVADTGIGISETNLKKLFTPFERIGADKLMVEGTGLGLTVVKKIVEVLGGIIDVKSQLGQGTTFTVDLPAIEGPAQQTMQSIDLLPDKSSLLSQKGTILYVEDNPSNVELVAHLLSEQRPGYSLITVAYGIQTHEYAQNYNPDLILLDINLPGLPGDKVLQELKANDHTSKIPVVVLSADAMPRKVSNLLKAGAFEYLTKPIDVIAFLEIVDNIMKSKNTRI